jgi:hypothetical protein
MLLRIGAACIMVVMMGAISLVHIADGCDVGKGGFGILPPPLRKFWSWP